MIFTIQNTSFPVSKYLEVKLASRNWGVRNHREGWERDGSLLHLNPFNTAPLKITLFWRPDCFIGVIGIRSTVHSEITWENELALALLVSTHNYIEEIEGQQCICFRNQTLYQANLYLNLSSTVTTAVEPWINYPDLL